MSTQETQPKVEVDASIMNFFGPNTIYTTVWPFSKFKSMATEAGYDGLEVHPLQLPVISGFQLRTGIGLNEDQKKFVRSMHQSWRSEKSFDDVLACRKQGLFKFAVSAFTYLTLTEREESLDDLDKIQRAVGRKLPAILFPPQSPQEESGVKRNYAEKLFQPTATLMDQWDIKTVTGLIKALFDKEYTGFCIDLHHLRQTGETTLNPWQETLPKLLPFTTEIHIAAGRVDMPNPNFNTMAELSDLLNGTSKTDLPKMLEMIAKSGWRGRLVTEISSSVLLQKLITVKSLIENHKRMINTIKDIFN